MTSEELWDEIHEHTTIMLNMQRYLRKRAEVMSDKYLDGEDMEWIEDLVYTCIDQEEGKEGEESITNAIYAEYLNRINER